MVGAGPPGSATNCTPCTDGYTGAACSVCSQGFFRQGLGCVACATTSPAAYATVLVALGLACVLIAVLVVRKRKTLRHRAETAATRAKAALGERAQSIKVTLAIVLGFLQILSVVDVVSHQ